MYVCACVFMFCGFWGFHFNVTATPEPESDFHPSGTINSRNISATASSLPSKTIDYPNIKTSSLLKASDNQRPMRASSLSPDESSHLAACQMQMVDLGLPRLTFLEIKQLLVNHNNDFNSLVNSFFSDWTEGRLRSDSWMDCWRSDHQNSGKMSNIVLSVTWLDEEQRMLIVCGVQELLLCAMAWVQ